MAKARAIVKRLKAVKNIRKITRTMELIATGRFKRAMDRASHAAAYTRKISEIVADLSQANLQISHPLLEPRPEPRSTTLLALTSNRGLCGGYNAGVLRLVIARIRETRQTPEALTLEVSGKRGINFLKFQGRPADRTYMHFEDKPTFAQVEELADRFIEAFTSKTIDRLQIAYTKFEFSLPPSRHAGDSAADRQFADPGPRRRHRQATNRIRVLALVCRNSGRDRPGRVQGSAIQVFS